MSCFLSFSLSFSLSLLLSLFRCDFSMQQCERFRCTVAWSLSALSFRFICSLSLLVGRLHFTKCHLYVSNGRFLRKRNSFSGYIRNRFNSFSSDPFRNTIHFSFSLSFFFVRLYFCHFSVWTLAVLFFHSASSSYSSSFSWVSVETRERHITLVIHWLMEFSW